MAQECDRLTEELADQVERRKLKEAEESLSVEFETQRLHWVEK